MSTPRRSGSYRTVISSSSTPLTPSSSTTSFSSPVSIQEEDTTTLEDLDQQEIQFRFDEDPIIQPSPILTRSRSGRLSRQESPCDNKKIKVGTPCQSPLGSEQLYNSSKRQQDNPELRGKKQTISSSSPSTPESLSSPFSTMSFSGILTRLSNRSSSVSSPSTVCSPILESNQEDHQPNSPGIGLALSNEFMFGDYPDDGFIQQQGAPVRYGRLEHPEREKKQIKRKSSKLVIGAPPKADLPANFKVELIKLEKAEEDIRQKEEAERQEAARLKEESRVRVESFLNLHNYGQKPNIFTRYRPLLDENIDIMILEFTGDLKPQANLKK